MTESRLKRQVKYNEDAILCPACKKRIRLNNDGRVRIHMSGKMGSDKCMGSNFDFQNEPVSKLYTDNVAVDPKPTDISTLQKESPPETMLFSDIV